MTNDVTNLLETERRRIDPQGFIGVGLSGIAREVIEEGLKEREVRDRETPPIKSRQEIIRTLYDLYCDRCQTEGEGCSECVVYKAMSMLESGDTL